MLLPGSKCLQKFFVRKNSHSKILEIIVPKTESKSNYLMGEVSL